MRVLAVINGMGTGGAERSLAESIEPLAKRGVDVEIAVLHRRREGVENAVAQSTTVHDLPGTWRNKLTGLRTLLQQGSFDLVHSTLFEADVLSRTATIRRTPLLTSLVNTSYDKTRLNDQRIRRSRFEGARAIDALTGRVAASHYHAITQAVADSAAKRLHIAPKRITVIPRGRNSKRLGTRTDPRRATAREQLGVDPDAELVVSVGRQEYQKGQVQIIEALGYLADRPHLQLLIAGREGNATPDINRAIASSPAAGRIRLLGHVDNVPDLLVAADALIFPSHFEGLGGTLIEAMALQTPVVTSDIPVTREVLGPAAVYVASGDPRALSHAMSNLLNDRGEQNRLATLGHARFLDRYQLDRVMDQMADLMNMLVDQ